MRPACPPVVAVLSLAAIVLAACSAAATPASAPSGSDRIPVTLSDALKIEPATFTVKAGSTVTFVVTNSGAIDHEFVIGDDKAQADHEQEMRSMGAMTMDEPNAIGVKPGETKELTYTFKDPGTLYAGCHEPGHYAAGMRATITVQ